ncbi:hypothetical protein JYB87_08745 [Shewanella avicenniae]|uniref:Uncharacterized protein n=1 Tax=Shewanella avicenniae TaxID=2814294 RepID=A0ABX7QW94_9GAMM|nr:hypothetical protein [Shewanella avicenniae]QSX35260.1 hypothetical protein JYB87_08745 [Shewanella avicenniae]
MFVLCLWFGMGATLPKAYAEQLDAVSLFVNQCLDYSEQFTPDFNSATALERNTIGLQNLADRLQYYRHFQLSNDDNEWLLQCQLSVADAINRLLNAPQMPAFIAQQTASNSPQLSALAKRYQFLRSQQFDAQQKLKLATLQAAVKQRLKSANFAIELAECALVTDGDPERHQPLASSIAQYMLNQSDSNCRMQVWQAYQARAVDYVKADINTLTEIQQQQASSQGFSHYVDAAFSHTLLGSADSAAAFLAAIVQPINVAPWNIGQQLKIAPKAEFSSLTRTDYIQQLTGQLQRLGITLQAVDENWLRLWHQQRYLGDVMLSEGRPEALLLRYAVVGQQTGIARLNLPAQLSNIAALQQANHAVAEIVGMMAASGQFYLINNLETEQDSNQLGTLWLNEYLNQQFHAEFPNGTREALFAQYQTQFERLKAIAALSLYRPKLSVNLQQDFANVFGSEWPQADILPYTFIGVSESGPLYLAQLFQRQLARALTLETETCDAAKVFSTLVVNEPQDDLRVIVEHIWPDGGIQQFIRQFNHGEYSPSLSTQCQF